MLALYKARSAKVEAGFAGTPSFVPRSRSNLLKERMIFSPNRSHFGGSCARNREHSVIQSVCQIPAAKCTQSRVLSIGEFGARARRRWPGLRQRGEHTKLAL